MTNMQRGLSDYLERAANRIFEGNSNNTWDLSYVPDQGRTALVADVYNSSSHPDYSITKYYNSTSLKLPVTAFSYASIGRAYLAIDTQQSIETSALLLLEYLPSGDHTNIVIPIGVSGGAVTVVLGVAAWIAASKFTPNILVAGVPRIILVAPAISPAARLYSDYLQRRVRMNVPVCVRELCDIGSEEWLRSQHRLSTAFALIKWAGIKISMIYWPHDDLTPYPWHPNLHAVAKHSVRRYPVCLPDLAPPNPESDRYPGEVVQGHLKFCKHTEVIMKVAKLLRR
jgi:hypothetical protein